MMKTSILCSFTVLNTANLHMFERQAEKRAISILFINAKSRAISDAAN